MKYIIDHDYHLHTHLSLCSSDPGETTAALLAYARSNGLSSICVTDHFWDSSIPGANGFYQPQDFDHISKSLPLPQSPDCKFLFGCECEMDKHLTIGMRPEMHDAFDFIIIPTTHLHMFDFTISPDDIDSHNRRATLCAERFDRLLASDLPLHKTGIAHLTCGLIAGNGNGKYAGEHLDIIDLIPDDTWASLFAKAEKAGLGIELNMNLTNLDVDQLRRIFRPYQIAKECGCKFYLGSDAHHPEDLVEAPARFEAMVSYLDLKEDDKFIPGNR